MIQWAFEAFSEGGWSLAKISAELNARGLTFKPSPKRPARPMTVSNTFKMLTNRFYAGEFKSGGVWHKGNYQPLVSLDTFQKVQARLSDNFTGNRPSDKLFYAFRPFLKCGYCHLSLTAAEYAGRHKRGHYVYYFCSSAKRRTDPDFYKKKFGTAKCPQKYWKEEEVDKAIAGEVGKLYLDETIVKKVREELKETDRKTEAFEKRELRRLAGERTRKKTHLRLCYEDRLNSKISIDQYSEIQAGIQNDLDHIERDIKRLSQKNFKAKEQGSRIIELLNGVAKIYQKADMPTKHKILEALVERITLRGNEIFVTWREPFDTLFDLGQMFGTKKLWGE